MRIAVVAPPWVPVPPVGYGGTELIIDSLARGFARHGHEVALATIPESTCPVPKITALEGQDPGRMNWSVLEMRHVIAAYDAFQDFDIVHDHTLVGPIYSQRFENLQVVTTQHHPCDDDFKEIFKASAAHVPVVSISRHQAARARGLNVEKVIHHGLDPRSFEYNEAPEDYFLFLGRMSPNKGAHRAAAVARAAGVNLKIAARLSDAEGEREYFHNEVEPLLGNGVEFVGECTVDEKSKLLRNARAILNPIRWPEPFGLVMIEALASGTPVIAFAEGAAPEIIEHGRTGFLCRNEREMIESIDHIEDIKRWTCRQAMAEYFSADRMVNEYLEYFETLLERKATLAGGGIAQKREVVDLRAVEAVQAAGSIEDELSSIFGERANPANVNKPKITPKRPDTK